MKLSRNLSYILTILILFFVQVTFSHAGADNGKQVNWKDEWAIDSNFSIEKDTSGYHYPTAVAFIPDPGAKPKDPLYFVTELRGKVKVVTNDRTVMTFAEDFLYSEYYDEPPEKAAEFGLAGICLEPKYGYVFVTFAYQDKSGAIKNNIIRFKSTPGTFSVKPESSLVFNDVFAHHESGPSHQIGHCQVLNNELYVGTGDGYKSPLGSQDKTSILGKILRMTLDGNPLSDNPFYVDQDKSNPTNYIWAYGVRNPFGLSAVGSKLYAVDNGLSIDRFLKVRKARNYLWNGNDWSIASHNIYTINPSLGPVQMDYSEPGRSNFPETYHGNFYVALSANKKGKKPGVLRIKYDVENEILDEVPQYFIKYRGSGYQRVGGVQITKDALYFVPIFPVSDGTSVVLKVSYNPDKPHPHTLLQIDDPLQLMKEKGCFGCHMLKDAMKLGGVVAPELDRGDGPMIDIVMANLEKDDYIKTLDEIDKMDKEPFLSYKKARQEMRDKAGLERAKLWIKYHIIEPRFDNPYSQMPNLGLTDSEATLITNYLFSKRGKKQEFSFKNLIPKPRKRHIVFAFAGGLVLGVILGFIIVRMFRATK